jgi:hypothetical protein
MKNLEFYPCESVGIPPAVYPPQAGGQAVARTIFLGVLASALGDPPPGEMSLKAQISPQAGLGGYPLAGPWVMEGMYRKCTGFYGTNVP